MLAALPRCIAKLMFFLKNSFDRISPVTKLRAFPILSVNAIASFPQWYYYEILFFQDCICYFF